MPEQCSCDCALRLDAIERRMSEQHADVVAELRALRTLFDQPHTLTLTPDAPHARLILALAATLTDLSLSFDAAEVLDAARLDCELDEALRALGLTTTAAVGAWLRTHRDRPLAGFVIRRDGRAWQIERCT